MKICYINPTKAERPIYQIAKRLADRGHTSTILQPPGRWHRYPAWDNVDVIEMPATYVPPFNYTLPSLYAQLETLTRLVRDEGYDLIHVYDYQYPTAWTPIVVRRRLGVPIMLTSNTLVGIVTQYKQGWLNLVARLYTHTIGRFLFRQYDRVFFLFERQADWVRARFGPNVASQVIPNGIDLDTFRPQPESEALRALRCRWNLPSDEPVILCVGRLVGGKRLDMALHILERLVAEGLACRLMIVGDGPLRDRLRERVSLLDGRAVMTGHVKPMEMPLYYALASVHLLTSAGEGLSAVVMEAAACGIPTVAGDVGGTASLVRHGETGFVCSTSDFEAYLAYTRTLIRDREQAVAMGRQARTYAERHFDWGHIVDQYERAFEETIEAAQHRRCR